MWFIEGHAFPAYCHRTAPKIKFGACSKCSWIWLPLNVHTNKRSVWVTVAADTTSKTRSKSYTLSPKTWTNPDLSTWHCWPAAGQSGLADGKQAWQKFWHVRLAGLRILRRSKPNVELLLVLRPLFCSSEQTKIHTASLCSHHRIHRQPENVPDLESSAGRPLSHSYRKVLSELQYRVKLLHRAEDINIQVESILLARQST